MKIIYMISRVVLAVIAFIVFSLVISNKNSLLNSVPIFFSLIVFVLSFPSTMFAEKIIDRGNKIEKTFLKVLYYIFLPIILSAICIAFCIGVLYIADISITPPSEIGTALSLPIFTLLILAVLVISVLLPCIQAIIIIILKRIMNHRSS